MTLERNFTMALKIGQILETVSEPLPSSNRGVVNTGLAMGRIILDWVSATFPYSDAIWERLIEQFGPAQERKTGALGYPNAVTILGTGVLLWNAQRPEMGLHLMLPAQALALYQFPALWLLEIIKNNDGKFTRIDLALDDFNQRLILEDILYKLENGHVQTRWKKYRAYLPETDIGQRIGQLTGISIGSRVSESYARIYDKRQEQEKKGHSDLPDNWIRFELETKGDRAAALGIKLIQEIRAERVGKFVANLIYGLLDFKEPSREDGNKSRWDTSAWWLLFLGAFEKERITLPKMERTLEQVKDWFSNDISAMACVILLSTMMDGQSGYEWLMEAIANGENKFKNKHKKLIIGYKENEES